MKDESRSRSRETGRYVLSRGVKNPPPSVRAPRLAFRLHDWLKPISERANPFAMYRVEGSEAQRTPPSVIHPRPSQPLSRPLPETGRGACVRTLTLYSRVFRPPNRLKPVSARAKPSVERSKVIHAPRTPSSVLRPPSSVRVVLLLAVLLCLLGNIGRVDAQSLFPGPVMDIAPLPGYEGEEAIAVNPVNPMQLFATSNIGQDGLMAAFSVDGGSTWRFTNPATGFIATDNSSLPAACCDPSVAFDRFGNLFLCYLSASQDSVVVLVSVDGGQSFRVLSKMRASATRSIAPPFPVKSSPISRLANVKDQPTLTVGPGGAESPSSAWVTYLGSDGFITAAGAPVTGLGLIGAFSAPEAAPSTQSDGNFGDIAIGPAGQVMVTWQNGTGTLPQQATIFVSVDSDGLGSGGFGPAIPVTTSNVYGFTAIPAQPNRDIDAEAGLAWDRSGGPNQGRLYMVYTDSPAPSSANTDVFVRHSDDSGQTWSARVRVNDDNTSNSQFLPRISLDQMTGNIAVSWYDSRNDLGTGGPGDTDGIPNDDAEFYASASVDGGNSFLPNIPVSGGASNANDATDPNDYGDYTGLTFYGGVLYPCWADNSNSTGTNPDGRLRSFDIYLNRVALIPAAAFPAGLSMVSLPYDFSGTALDAATLFGLPVDATGMADIAAYDPTAAKYLIYPNLPMTPRQTQTGRGYWILEAAPHSLAGMGTTVASPFHETLPPGWNIIGDPFQAPVYGSTLEITSPIAAGGVPANTPVTLAAAQSAGIVGSALYTWDRGVGQYLEASALLPYTGYWIYIDPKVATQPVTLTLTR